MQTQFGFFAGGLLACLLLASGCSVGDSSPPGSVSGTIETDEARVASRYGGRVEKTLAQEGDSLNAGQRHRRTGRRRTHAPNATRPPPSSPNSKPARARRKSPPPNTTGKPSSPPSTRPAWTPNAPTNSSPPKTISATEHDQALTRVRTLENNVAAAKSRYDLLLAGTRPERLAQARAQLAEIDAQLREMNIAAPTNSVLEVLSVKVGDVLAPNQSVATLLLTNHLWVRVYVPEPWLGRIQLGQAVTVRVDSHPGKDFPGVVEQIARAAEFTPRNVQTVAERIKQVFGIKVRLDNREGILRAGMAADVTFPGVPK